MVRQGAGMREKRTALVLTNYREHCLWPGSYFGEHTNLARCAHYVLTVYRTVTRGFRACTFRIGPSVIDRRPVSVGVRRKQRNDRHRTITFRIR